MYLSRPTACVTRWWVGRDNATWTEPTSSHENCLKTRRLPPVGCTVVGWGHPISLKKQGRNGSILPSGRHISRTLALVSQMDSRGAPWFPITMIYQLVTPSAIPIRKLYNLSDRVCPRQMTKARRRRFRKRTRRLFVVNLPTVFSSQILYICFLERCVSPLLP